ncbi:Sporulation domain protein [Nitrosococcus halophilus Nc 4]|uniref:Sporulation domain protein n=1 Tax=Nitrosococcus halophilus (strain Nc4) TaxID=472759 RepID=D5C451_NITHN|nr:SPOR domain-containing protein [Nitrosococcus halophilus]ADE13239.1 Sporulation domain protein [Nitrosococcus halophilus Nc 4]
MPPNKRRRRTSSGQTSKPWSWLIAGLLVGALVMFLPSLQNWLPWIGKSADNTPPVENAIEAQKASTEQSTTPRFEFYTLLPKMEVAVPEPKPLSSQQQPKPQPKAPPEPSPKPTPKPSPSKSVPSQVYVLQAGSFRSYAQADKRKADLALMGVEATIQTVTIGNSKTWHRVRIGPSSNLPNLQRIRQQLRKNQIECQMFKVKS